MSHHNSLPMELSSCRGNYLQIKLVLSSTILPLAFCASISPLSLFPPSHLLRVSLTRWHGIIC